MGGWVGWVEEKEAVGMLYCELGVGWMGGWVGGWVTLRITEVLERIGFWGRGWSGSFRVGGWVGGWVGWVGGWTDLQDLKGFGADFGVEDGAVQDSS